MASIRRRRPALHGSPWHGEEHDPKNICKIPSPSAPFIPPNIGKSNLSPKVYTTTVKLEGHTVVIRGATFESTGDIASKGTGGSLISANTHGPTKFITPGSMDVQMEGTGVHLLGEPMLNNCGPSGSPPNTGATMAGFDTFDRRGQTSRRSPATATSRSIRRRHARSRRRAASSAGRSTRAAKRRFKSFRKNRA